MQAEPDTCVLIVKAANVPGECYAEHVGQFVIGVDHAAADGLGVLMFTDSWRDAHRFETPEAAQAFVEARSLLRPTVGGEPHRPAAPWSYNWAWMRDVVETVGPIEAEIEMADAVAEAAAHRGLRH